MPYPNVEVLEPSDALALILQSLDKGELPVLCTMNGSTRRLLSIRNSAMVLHDLSLVTKLKYNKSESESCELNTIEDIMEVLS